MLVSLMMPPSEPEWDFEDENTRGRGSTASQPCCYATPKAQSNLIVDVLSHSHMAIDLSTHHKCLVLLALLSTLQGPAQIGIKDHPRFISGED